MKGLKNEKGGYWNVKNGRKESVDKIIGLEADYFITPPQNKEKNPLGKKVIKGRFIESGHPTKDKP